MTPKANDLDETTATTSSTNGTMEEESNKNAPDCDFVTSSISEEDHSQFSEASYDDEEEEEDNEDGEGTDWDSLGPASPSQRRRMKGPFLEDDLEEEEEDDASSRPLENIYGIPRLGDPLPVVSEEDSAAASGSGSNTSPSSRRSTTHNAAPSTTNGGYEDEPNEFHVDMNTTKVAFASYRNAVLHLVQHQDRKSSSSSPTTRDNERMSHLEDHAKWYVEQKAQTFVEAVPVAMEWREWSMARKAGIHNVSVALKERREVGVELIQKLKEEKEKKKRRRVEKKMEEDRRERNTTRKSGGVGGVLKESTSKSSSTSSKPPSKPKPKSKKSTPPPPIVSKPKPKRTTLETIGVPRRKAPSRHPSCIKHTLPKFQPPTKSKNSKKKEEPMTYRTTEWIDDLIQWRIARRKHLEETLRTCGCPDCCAELDGLERMGSKKGEMCSR